MNQYQREALRFINKDLTLDEQRLHALLGLSSECGELCGIFQKEYQGHEISREHVVKEAGDILWMICEFLTVEGIDLDEVMETNIKKLSARYPDGFECAKSINRTKGDI